MQDEILTIGYQGASLDGFVAALKDAGVATLIDVRDAPWSRRGEFIKDALAETLAGHGIVYRHLKGLGNPKAGREAARGGDTAAYHRILAKQLKSTVGRTDLGVAAEIALGRPSCLMCFERDPKRCHRSIVAERLAEATGLTLRHLSPTPDDDSQPRLL